MLPRSRRSLVENPFGENDSRLLLIIAHNCVSFNSMFSTYTVCVRGDTLETQTYCMPHRRNVVGKGEEIVRHTAIVHCERSRLWAGRFDLPELGRVDIQVFLHCLLYKRLHAGFELLDLGSAEGINTRTLPRKYHHARWLLLCRSARVRFRGDGAGGHGGGRDCGGGDCDWFGRAAFAQTGAHE